MWLGNHLISSSGHQGVPAIRFFHEGPPKRISCLLDWDGSSQNSVPSTVLKKWHCRHQRYKMWHYTESSLSLSMLHFCYALSPWSVPLGSSLPLIASSLPGGGLCVPPNTWWDHHEQSLTRRGTLPHECIKTHRVLSKRPPKKTPSQDHLLLWVCSLFHPLFPLSSAFSKALLTCLSLNIDFV